MSANNMRSKQIIVIGAIVVLVGFLFTRDIKALVASSDGDKATSAKPEAGMPAPATVQVSIAEASATAKNLIGNNLGKEITQLENAYQNASGADKVAKAKELAQKWEDVEQSVPSALYLEEVAQEESSLANWINAGDRFLKAFDNTQDTVAQPAMLQKANNAFKKAMAIDSANLDAKTGLGITIVNGMGAPMQGIGMLLDVVKRDPNNIKANMNLGLFAMKSGQFDKAVKRFEDMLQHGRATPDIYFYLATAYENLGENQKAVDAYLKSKKMAANPTLTSFIDKKVAELKSKN